MTVAISVELNVRAIDATAAVSVRRRTKGLPAMWVKVTASLSRSAFFSARRRRRRGTRQPTAARRSLPSRRPPTTAADNINPLSVHPLSGARPCYLCSALYIWNQCARTRFSIIFTTVYNKASIKWIIIPVASVIIFYKRFIYLRKIIILISVLFYTGYETDVCMRSALRRFRYPAKYPFFPALSRHPTLIIILSQVSPG